LHHTQPAAKRQYPLSRVLYERQKRRASSLFDTSSRSATDRTAVGSGLRHRVAFETSHTGVEARFLERALRPGAVVLDAGCGRKTRLLAHRPSIVELVGVDLDEAGCENPALDKFVRADLCRRLPFSDRTFDLVYANFVVEHLDGPEAAFREWRRVLRPEGALVLLTSNLANPFLAAARLLPENARIILKRLGPGVAERDVIPPRYRANTPERLASMLASAGFVPVSVCYVATLHRYAGMRVRLAALLRLLERLLPERRRSTIVAWYRPGRRQVCFGRPA
jgi:SAM-dependent methyltransferase